MITTTLRIATRKSPLALWQAHYVKTQLEKIHPHLQIELLGLLTEGDKLLASPLSAIGGKGLFVRELNKAILERRADIAVHSIKDMPATLHNDLVLAAICKRADPRDALLSIHFSCWQDLPKAAVIGTSSLRRQCQIKYLSPELHIENLRGNIGTRLRRLAEDRYDAIILAVAGLQRIGEIDQIRQYFAIEEMLPAIGQGAIGIECRGSDIAIRELVAPLDDLETRYCITAERSMNAYLQGGCQLPLAGNAIINNGELLLRGLVGNADGHRIITASSTGTPEQAELIGEEVAKKLLAQGADKILHPKL